MRLRHCHVITLGVKHPSLLLSEYRIDRAPVKSRVGPAHWVQTQERPCMYLVRIFRQGFDEKYVYVQNLYVVFWRTLLNRGMASRR